MVEWTYIQYQIIASLFEVGLDAPQINQLLQQTLQVANTADSTNRIYCRMRAERVEREMNPTSTSHFPPAERKLKLKRFVFVSPLPIACTRGRGNCLGTS